MKITDKTFDLADKYRVIVEIDDTRAILLKFDNEVNDEECFEKAKKYLEDEQAQYDLIYPPEN
jgi:hypothetical protein